MSQVAGPPRQPVPSPSVPIAARRSWWRRRALIIPFALVVTVAVAAALFLVLRPRTVTAGGTVIDGRRLQATDVDWSIGAGALLQAPAHELVLTLCGREIPVTAD